MADMIMILILAVSVIIGYLLMAGVDGFIDRHVAGRNKQETETKADEHAEPGEQKRKHSGLPVFLNIER